MAGGFKVADAFVEVTTKDETSAGLGRMRGSLVAWAGGLGLGALITKGITDNLDARAGTAKLAGQLNLTAAEAARAGQVAGSVYRQQFGSSLEEVRTAVKAVGTNLVDLSTESPARVEVLTKAAQGLADTMGIDVTESTKAAAAMVRNGLAPNAEAAFDLITRGAQNGLDAAGDFTETISEYSPQFRKLGLDGAESFALLQAAMKAGARDTDVVADAFKELSIRAVDGTKLTAEGFKAIGTDAKKMAADFGAGGDRAEGALRKTLDGLLAIKDPVKQNQAGVALFGTQWEDTVRTILPALAKADSGLAGTKGATDAMNASVAAGADPVDAMQRKMEGWLANVTALPGPLGATSSGIAAMGTQGIIAAAALGQVAPAAGGMAAGVARGAGTAISWLGRMAWSGITSAASFVASAITTGARWTWMGVQATAAGIRMAAAWFVALGPIGWVTAAVIGLVVLIIAKWDWVSARGKAIWGAFWGWLSGLWGTIWSGTVSKWNSFTGFMTSIPGKVASAFLRWTLLGIIISHWSQIVSGVQNKANSLVSLIGSIPGRIRGALGNLGSLLWDAGSSIIQGLINGITSRIGSLRDKLSAVTRYIPDWKGPMELDLRLLEPSGEAVMSGFVRGLDRGVSGVESKLRGLTQAMPGMMPAPALAGVGSAAMAAPPPARMGDTWSIGQVVIPAADLEEMRTVFDFFDRVEQEARRLQPGGVRRG